jgi:hypothetical protein
MYYGSYTVGTRVGKRYEGIEHLKKLAKIITDKYELKTEVLGNVTGKIYENHLATTAWHRWRTSTRNLAPIRISWNGSKTLLTCSTGKMQGRIYS